MTEQNLDNIDFSTAPEGPLEGDNSGNNLDNFDFKAEPEGEAPQTTESEEATDLSEGEPSAKEKQQQEQETGKPWWKEVKFGDQVYELESEDQAKQLLQKGFGADKKFQDAARKEKQLAEALKQAKNDPSAVLRQLGYNEDQILQWHENELARRIEYNSMSPEERERREQQTELQRLRAEKQRAEQQQQYMRQQQMKKQASQQLENRALQALDNAGLATDDPQENYATMYDAMKQLMGWKAKQMRNGAPSEITTDVLESFIRRTHNNRQQSLKKMVSKYDPDTLREVLGKEGTEKVRKALLKDRKSAPTNKSSMGYASGSKQARDGARNRSKKNETISEHEFDKMMRDMKD